MASRSNGQIAVAAAAALLAIAPAAAQDAPRLTMPIDCDPGKTCWIQHYVDIDEGPGVQDFHCGTATYEGHKGIDFRLLSSSAATAAHVPVLAAAPGVVKGVRDGMIDAFARETGKAGITDRECGNGMVIDHGRGWETQYCHLKQGSVLVRSGQQVTRGQKLGEVGWSGLADFAHLHLSVRKNGRVIEPFTGAGQTGTCARDVSGPGVWDDSVIRAFPYHNGEIFDARFTDGDPVEAELEHDHLRLPLPTQASPKLTFYVRILNVRAGDTIRLAIDGPGGFKSRAETAPRTRNQQVDLVGVSRKRVAPAWETGTYTATAMLLRGGQTISERREVLELK